MRRLLLLAITLVLAATALTACGDDEADSGPVSTVEAGEEITINGGRTTLALDGITAGVLHGAGVSVEAVEPATESDRSIRIPVIDGELTKGTLAGSIEHEGGIAFVAGNRRVVYEDLRIDTVAKQMFSGVGTRTPVFDLDLRAVKSVEAGDAIVIDDVVAWLATDAAEELNDGLQVSAFVPRQVIGKVTVRVAGS